MNDKNQSNQTHDQLKRQEDEKRLLILEGIARGERAIKEGNVLSHQDAKAKLAKWLS
jgi:predicted transcriptional regulator